MPVAVLERYFSLPYAPQSDQPDSTATEVEGINSRHLKLQGVMDIQEEVLTREEPLISAERHEKEWQMLMRC